MTDDLPSDLNSAKPDYTVRTPRKNLTYPAHKTGGVVQTADTMSADQRKLADRINVNEIMQMQDDARAGGWGTSRETMPPPPTTVDKMSGGGRVQKFGSSTHVSCKTKHGG
jgi:hypothetical protein